MSVTATTTAETPAPQVHGRIGLPTASALYVAAVLGTGILVLPGLGVDAAGPASILSVVIVLALSIPLAGTFAALAGRYPDGGGVATFVRLALGDTAARATGYWFLFGVGFGAPVVATLAGEYLTAAFGIEGAWVGPIGIGFLVISLVLNLFGVRVSGRLQLGLSALLVAVVVGVIASAAPAARAENFTPFLPHGWEGVGLGVSLFVWAFAGGEAITHIAHEFRNPRRTIAWATVIGLTVVGLAYLALQVVTVGVFGAAGSRGDAPLIDLVAINWPGFGPAVVGGIATIIVLGVLNAYVPAFANLTASLGRDGHLPRWFAKGAEAGAVPRRALALVAVLLLGYATLFTALGVELQTFILIHTASMVALYFLGMVAAVRLLERGTVGWWMALVSLVFTGALLVLAWQNLLVPALLAVVAVAVTLIRRFRRA
ncbi:amino acid permease [Protaetiibacter sp. SSC-01]|uniref:APC family permease n=1 Tax=Protaetiibacter sp. SSC-01 TaxID=2759943 RepID=UPI001656DACE|nr:amino acid permease [Protaetiibacter sp. SSC-01]QNO37168.1 amino acid permease [Protaetiibacter sp. SSC-01]